MTADRPKVRIVHPGGPACLTQVWVDDRQLMNVTRIEIEPLDATDNGPATVKLTLADVEIALEAELAELVVREVAAETTTGGGGRRGAVRDRVPPR